MYIFTITRSWLQVYRRDSDNTYGLLFVICSYRATHDIRRLTEDAKREKQRIDNRQKKRLPPSTVFGVPTRYIYIYLHK